MSGAAQGAFSDQVAIVTGGTAGIGLALATALAERGGAVLVVGRRPARTEAAAARIRAQVPGADVDGAALDVSSAPDMQRMAELVLERHGRIDILIACAGVLRPSSGRIATVRDTRLADWDEVLKINLGGVFLSNRAVLPAMLARRSGQIVNVASTSALRGHAFDAAYCASKFAMLGLSEALAEEVRPHGIRVQAVLPGATESMIWEQNGPVPKPQHILPVERLVRAILFLLSLSGDALVPRLTLEPHRGMDQPGWLQPLPASS